MTAEGVAMEGSKFKLSADLLPAEALERSKIGNKFEKVKCAKDPSLVFDEVGVCLRDGIVGVVGQIGQMVHLREPDAFYRDEFAAVQQREC